MRREPCASNRAAAPPPLVTAGDTFDLSATACGIGAQAHFNESTAVGHDAEASALGATAVGANTNFLPAGNYSVAVGDNASSQGANSVAVGGASSGAFAASASAEKSVAIGYNAKATFTNSTAIGEGAHTTRADQQMFGHGSDPSDPSVTPTTYTMAGINTNASRAAQTGAVSSLNIVTTDVDGNLAGRSAASLGLASSTDVANLQSDVTGLQSQINGLGRRDSELADGIAISLALAQPIMLPGQTFAVRGGWGNFDGSNAVGFTAAGVVAKGVVIDGGVGTSTSENMVAGRAGLSLGW